MLIKALIISDYRETASVRPEAELFIGLKKTGVEVEIMTHGEAEYVAKFEAAGIRVIDFHPKKKFDKKEIAFIREVLVSRGYHVMHLFNSKAIINGIRAAKNLPVKVVLYRGYTGNIHWYDPAAYLKFLHPRVDKIFCIARSVEEHIQKQWFFDKNKTATIHKGHAPEWYAHVEPAQRPSLGIPEDAFMVVNVANNRPMKGIPVLIRALSFLPPGLPVHLVLAGKNMDDAENLRLIRQSPYRDNIHLPGYRSDALSIVKAAGVFVLPSIRGEATTKAVIEAMSLGVAPVITDIAGNRGLVVDGACGVVVPKKDPRAIAAALLRLCNDRELCRRFGEAAKRHVAANFHIKDTIFKTKKLYEELAAH